MDFLENGALISCYKNIRHIIDDPLKYSHWISILQWFWVNFYIQENPVCRDHILYNSAEVHICPDMSYPLSTRYLYS